MPVAVVTGGTSGIGAASCAVLSEAGYTVVSMARHAPPRDAATSLAVSVDVRDSRAVTEALDVVVERFGGLDVVVASAGTDDPVIKDAIGRQLAAGEPVLTTPSLSDADWRRMFEVNADGTFYTVRAACTVMRRYGAGAIVTVASDAAFQDGAGYPHYVASKSAVVALTRSIAREMLPHGIRINGVAPGPVDTPMFARTPSTLREHAYAARSGRVAAAPRQIADVIAFLVSDRASAIAGQTILVNAGRTPDRGV